MTMNDTELRNALGNIEIEDYLGILKLGKKLIKTIKATEQENCIKIAVLGSWQHSAFGDGIKGILIKIWYTS